MRKFRIFLLLLLIPPGILRAQQYPVLDEYRINPGIIAPSFTGFASVFQLYLTHRADWTGIPGSPVTGTINAEGKKKKNMGLGTNITLNKAGMVRYFAISLNYAYHLKIAADHSLHFGINPTLYQNSIDYSNAVVSNPNDPMITGGDKRTETYINCGTSLMYSFKTLNICIGFPYLFNNKTLYHDSQYSNVLTMSRNFLAYVNYDLTLSDNWSVQFDLLYRNIQYTPWLIDVGVMFKLKDSFWLGLLYRKGNILAGNIGVCIARSLVLGYNYEWGFTSMLGKSGGTHEVTLGYTLQTQKTMKNKKMLKLKEY